MLEKKFLTSPISYEGLHRVEGAEYPFEAVREMLLNAILHRDYSGAPVQVSVYDNKLMVWNEGILPEGLSIDDLKVKHPSRPRNKLLADVCFKGGLIEAWGRGTVKIYEECSEFGLPEPDIVVSGGGISVTIYNGIYKERELEELGLNTRQVEVLKILQINRAITNKEYTEMFKVSRNTASRDLNTLKEKKLIKSSGLKGVGSTYEILIRIV